MKRVMAALLAVSIVLGLLLSALAAASDATAAAVRLPNFMGIDDERIFDLSERYAPIDDGYGVYYIPHFALTESNLGVQWSWSQQQRYLTFRWGGKTITFELGSNAFDGNGVTYPIISYGISQAGVMHYFVNLDFICQFFGWKFTKTSMDDYGNTLFRIITKDDLKNEVGLLYRWKRAEEIDRLYHKYIAALSVGATPEPPVPVTGSPAPSPVTPSVKPSTEPPPSASATPAPSASAPPSQKPPDATPLPLPPLGIYITFDGALSEETDGILDILDRHAAGGAGYIRAAFFLQADSLAEHPATARRIAARHTMGLLLDAPGGGYAALADAACARLDRVTLRVTKLVRVTEPSEDAAAALEPGGYRLWGWTLDATGQASGDLVEYVRAHLPETGPVVLRLSLDEDTRAALPALLRELSDETKYFLRVLDIIDRPIVAEK